MRACNAAGDYETEFDTECRSPINRVHWPRPYRVHSLDTRYIAAPPKRAAFSST